MEVKLDLGVQFLNYNVELFSSIQGRFFPLYLLIIDRATAHASKKTFLHVSTNSSIYRNKWDLFNPQRALSQET